MKPADEQEQRMIGAHRAGLLRANTIFAEEVSRAIATFVDDPQAQFSYLAGLCQELRRLATRQQNKGLRL